jgi:PPM family protein phosphatase
MLRVAEQYAGSDTGRQRRANEDSLLARAPLFVVADGMGGAQAGEVASRIAVESFGEGLHNDANSPEEMLAEHARAANARIHELSQSNAEQAGMGTTLTALYVGELEVAIAHVGDSRAYCLRDGELLRLTDDHSLVDELIRQGRLTPEEAEDHPQRSIITRALGPEEVVEVDTRSYRARTGDVFLLCSDGLTTMLGERQLAEVLRAHPRLRDAGETLIARANEAGGRDNITVILLRVEEVRVNGGEIGGYATLTDVGVLGGGGDDGMSGDVGGGDVGGGDVGGGDVGGGDAGGGDVGGGDAGGDGGAAPSVTRASASQPAPAVGAATGARRPRQPRRPVAVPPVRRGRSRLRRAVGPLAALGVLCLLLAGAYLASQSVYFIGTNSRGLVTLYQGVPYELPAGIELYSSSYVSGVSAATLSEARRHTLLDHSLRSESDATSLMHSLELGQLSEG